MRVWYLNLIRDGVFDGQLNDDQLDLKNSIEDLAIKATENEEARTINCYILNMYNDMLKEKFEYTPSTIRAQMQMKEAIPESDSDKRKSTREASKETGHVANKEQINNEVLPEMKNENKNLEKDETYRSGKQNSNNSDSDSNKGRKPDIATETVSDIKDANMSQEEGFSLKDKSTIIEDKAIKENEIADESKDNENYDSVSEFVISHKAKDEFNLEVNKDDSQVSLDETEIDTDVTETVYDDLHLETVHENDVKYKRFQTEDTITGDSKSTENDYSVLSEDVQKEKLIHKNVQFSEDNKASEDLMIGNERGNVQMNGSAILNTTHKYAVEDRTTMKIPFGVCMKSGCFKFDVFNIFVSSEFNDLHRNDSFHKNDNINIKENKSDILAYSTKCFIDRLCTSKYYLLYAATHCILGDDFQNNTSEETNIYEQAKDNSNMDIVSHSDFKTITMDNSETEVTENYIDILNIEGQTNETTIPIKGNRTTKEEIKIAKDVNLSEEEHKNAMVNNLTSIKSDYNQTKETDVLKNIPFGVCVKSECVRYDIFSFYVFNLDHCVGCNVTKSNDSDLMETDSTVSAESNTCPVGIFCSNTCYLAYTITYCNLGYGFSHTTKEMSNGPDDTEQNSDINIPGETIYISDNAEGITGTLNTNNQISNDNSDLSYETSTFTETHSMGQNTAAGDKTNLINLENFPYERLEKIVNQRTSEYNIKIQTLELMIMKLENQVLVEKLNKQNHSSTITRLENMILKLENDLLRMYKTYEMLRDDFDQVNKKQNKYLEIAQRQEQQMGRNPELSNANLENLELVSKHQARISELSQIINNQTIALNHMKNKSLYLEEQNRNLQQLITNQTNFMTQILQKVQTLSEQNLKQTQQVQELKQTVGDIQTGNELVKVSTLPLSTHSDTFITKLDSLAFDEKVNLNRIDVETENKQQYMDKAETYHLKGKSELHFAELFALRWCSFNFVDSISCLYCSILHLSDCVPYQNLVWLKCTRNCTTDHIVGMRKKGDSPSLPLVSTDTSDQSNSQEVFKDKEIKQNQVSNDVVHNAKIPSVSVDEAFDPARINTVISNKDGNAQIPTISNDNDILSHIPAVSSGIYDQAKISATSAGEQNHDSILKENQAEIPNVSSGKREQTQIPTVASGKFDQAKVPISSVDKDTRVQKPKDSKVKDNQLYIPTVPNDTENQSLDLENKPEGNSNDEKIESDSPTVFRYQEEESQIFTESKDKDDNIPTVASGKFDQAEVPINSVDKDTEVQKLKESKLQDKQSYIPTVPNNTENQSLHLENKPQGNSNDEKLESEIPTVFRYQEEESQTFTESKDKDDNIPTVASGKFDQAEVPINSVDKDTEVQKLKESKLQDKQSYIPTVPKNTENQSLHLENKSQGNSNNKKLESVIPTVFRYQEEESQIFTESKDKDVNMPIAANDNVHPAEITGSKNKKQYIEARTETHTEGETHPNNRVINDIEETSPSATNTQNKMVPEMQFETKKTDVTEKTLESDMRKTEEKPLDTGHSDNESKMSNMIQKDKRESKNSEHLESENKENDIEESKQLQSYNKESTKQMDSDQSGIKQTEIQNANITKTDNTKKTDSKQVDIKQTDQTDSHAAVNPKHLKTVSENRNSHQVNQTEGPKIQIEEPVKIEELAEKKYSGRKEPISLVKEKQKEPKGTCFKRYYFTFEYLLVLIDLKYKLHNIYS